MMRDYTPPSTTAVSAIDFVYLFDVIREQQEAGHEGPCSRTAAIVSVASDELSVTVRTMGFGRGQEFERYGVRLERGARTRKPR